MSDLYKIVRGDPFPRGTLYSVPCVWYNNAGAPVDLTGYTIVSNLRTKDGELVAILDGEIDQDQVTNTGAFVLLSRDEDTSGWPIADDHVQDIRCMSNGVDVATDVFIQPVRELISRDV